MPYSAPQVMIVCHDAVIRSHCPVLLRQQILYAGFVKLTHWVPPYLNSSSIHRARRGAARFLHTGLYTESLKLSRTAASPLCTSSVAVYTWVWLHLLKVWAKSFRRRQDLALCRRAGEGASANMEKVDLACISIPIVLTNLGARPRCLHLRQYGHHPGDPPMGTPALNRVSRQKKQMESITILDNILRQHMLQRVVPLVTAHPDSVGPYSH